MNGYDFPTAGVPMFILRRLPACLSLLMLGALALRLGLPFWLAVPLNLALLVTLCVPKTPAQRLVGGFLWVGVPAWLGVAWVRVGERLDGGQPWMRLAVILGAVALFTGWSAWLMKEKKK